jgi:hypothetical protein
MLECRKHTLQAGSSQPLAIVEIGGGTGTLAASVLVRKQPSQCCLLPAAGVFVHGGSQVGCTRCSRQGALCTAVFWIALLLATMQVSGHCVLLPAAELAGILI